MFIQVWRTAGAFDERRGQPLGWLIMLTRSRAIDRLRSRPTRARATEAGTLPVPESAAESYPAIRRAVGSLPEEQRSLIELAYFGGLTQSEIARRVGQPLDTVRTRICTGMIRLREQLGETTGTQREGAAR
jgi:RNA polymerase sigma-70 factor (ECF subfamily)